MVKRAMLVGAALLGVFGLLGALLVSTTYEGTLEQIASNERAALLQQIYSLVPKENFDNDLLADVLDVSDEEALGSQTTRVYRARMQGQPVAVILSPVMAKGYGGKIQLIVAIEEDGKLMGIRVLTHKETPGLGDKIEESRSDWILGFAGLSLDNPPSDKWKVKRDGGYFDQFTGATITPRAIVAAAKLSLEYYQANKKCLWEPTSGKQTDGT